MYVTRTPESLESGHCEYTLEREFTEAELNHFCTQEWSEFCQYEPHSKEVSFVEGTHIDDELTVVLNWLYSL